jgi:RNA polymerase sigma-70 factor, ECF subfamily
MTDPDPAHDFQPHREFLQGLAYRMLGSVSEAEDIVQEAFLRWSAADRTEVVVPRAFLSRVVTRLCLDQLKSARARREHYVGTWLPEPVVAAPPTAPDALELADDISIALLVTLERLSPLERAAFLLHDVFGVEFSEIAGVLDRGEPAVRQLAARARDHVRTGRPRYAAPAADATRLAAAFVTAVTGGDVAQLANLLAADVVLYSDGGGKRHAALNPIVGRDRVTRFLLGVAKKRARTHPGATIEAAQLNGLPGFLIRSHEGVETIALELDGDAIVRVYGVRNPDKLRHLAVR